MSEKLDGASIVARSLKEQGVEYMFGVVGIPVIEVALRAQQYGIKYIGMRNEQSASYAASAIGYMTRRPAVCLVVSGPGFVHALAGMANSNENAWPLIVIGGSSETILESCMAFQEFPQVGAAKYFAKYAARPSSLTQLPFFIEKAVRMSTYGRPGAVYIDLPAEMITSEADAESICKISVCEDAPRPYAPKEKIEEVFRSLKQAKKPLFIIGKGAAYAQAENELNKLVNRLKVPVLPTPMGKGVVDDDSEYCISAARSTALKEADLVVLFGARLNWMLHFGKSPRFMEDVKIVQIDINAEELGNNTSNCVRIQSDLKSFGEQLNEFLDQNKEYSVENNIKDWWKSLKGKVIKNKSVIQAMADDSTVPLNYYAAYAQIKKVLPSDCIIVSEGANTMDTSRSILNHRLPRHRLDAGSFGTMGVGSGFAIASALICRDRYPNKRVVCIQGDSAFGFGGMEIETAFRYNLPVIFVIFNNNGIYGGLDKNTFDSLRTDGDPCLNLPPMTLTANIRYDKLSSAFENFNGYHVETPDQIRNAFEKALAEKNRPSIINVAINPSADRKAQEFPWLTKSKM